MIRQYEVVVLILRVVSHPRLHHLLELHQLLGECHRFGLLLTLCQSRVVFVVVTKRPTVVVLVDIESVFSWSR